MLRTDHRAPFHSGGRRGVCSMPASDPILALAFLLVLMGMANNLPNIPGLLEFEAKAGTDDDNSAVSMNRVFHALTLC